jgi:hypothetical protein
MKLARYCHLCALCVSAAILLPAEPRAFHVSQDGPLASLEQARDAVRALKREQGGALKQPVTVFVHAGTYTLSRPATFTPQDSGSAECPVVYRAYGNQAPVFSGGRAITGWKQTVVDGKHLWAAEVPGVREGKWYFRELWVNGQRRQRARGPKQGFYRMADVPDLDLHKFMTGQSRFQYSPGEIAEWENLPDVEIVALHLWVSSREGIAAVDENKRMVKLAYPSSCRLSDGNAITKEKLQFARYYVENAFELLDSPGEWYLNRKTGILYYMPLAGEKIAAFEAVAPVLDHLLSIEGDAKAQRFVEHITFRGLGFSYAEWWLPEDATRNSYQEQASARVPAAIRAGFMRDCSFEACNVSHVSGYGIHFAPGCSRDRIVACAMSDLGAGGIKIGDPNTPGTSVHHVEIADNHLFDMGKVFHQAMGILAFQCHDILIAHNHVHDLYKNAISVGWSWNFAQTQAANNVIEWNHIHDVGKGWFNDGGAIYTLGVQPGTVIRNNLMHDIESAVYGGFGVYLDQGSSKILVEKNISFDTTNGFSQTHGHDNIVRNNIFAFGKTVQITPSGAPDDSFLFERNILYWAPEAKLLRFRWPDTKAVLRRNLYWQAGGGKVMFGPETWDQWRARGRDEGAIVADPRFEDPAKHDFRLKPDSPARQIGFEPFNLSGVGPRAEVLEKLRSGE